MRGSSFGGGPGGWQGLCSSAQLSSVAWEGFTIRASGRISPSPTCCRLSPPSPVALLFPASRHLISLPTTLYSTDRIRRELGMQFLDRKTTLRDQVEGMKRRGLLPGFKG